MWFIGVEVEQETSAPPPKKILDPPLFFPEKMLKMASESLIHAMLLFFRAFFSKFPFCCHC